MPIPQIARDITFYYGAFIFLAIALLFARRRPNTGMKLRFGKRKTIPVVFTEPPSPAPEGSPRKRNKVGACAQFS